MKSIFVKKIAFTQDTKDVLLSQFQSALFTSEKGEGIHIIDYSANFVSCQFLIERIYSQSTYNVETEEFDKIEFTRIECIPFFVDFEMRTIDIVGNKQQAIRVLDFFGRITKYKIAIEDAQIDLLRLLESCQKSNVQYSISRVKISEYAFFDNIFGDCTLNLHDYPKALDVIKKFEKQIISVTLNICLDDACSVIFYKSGSVSIYKDPEDIDIEIIRLLKQGL